MELTPARIWARIAARRDGGRVVALIDGGSGSGKSSLATALAESAEPGLQVVSLDDVYPGWDGLAAASEACARDILDPERPGYRRWDWARGQVAGWVELDPGADLVVEGCGAITAASRARADVAIWLELDAAERRRRALARDGATFAPHWERWAAQEATHLRRDRPRERADWVLRPAPDRDAVFVEAPW